MAAMASLNIIHGGQRSSGVPVHHIGRRADDSYTLVDGETPRWGVTIDWGERATLPSREQLVWPAAGVAVIGGGAAVYFLDLETATIRLRVPLHGYFGHLAVDRESAADGTLFLLGCTEVIAFRPSLEIRWHAKDVAVDGVTFDRVEGSRLWVKAEMDPPDRWYAVEINVHTGKEISRQPSFSPDDLTLKTI